MDKKKFDLQSFLERNRHKIPKSVDARETSSTEIEGGIVIHASTFDLGLYLPFHPLIREILSKLGLAPIQLSPNCFRIMLGIIALNQIYKINLGWNEFCRCYAVKQKCPGIYYFSHRETTTVLVTDLPKYEKGRKDDLISLTGDWERRSGDTDTHVVPRIKAAPSHKFTGLKPRDSDVNHLDLKIAWDLPHEERNWGKLCAYLEQREESKIADESQASLLTALCPQHNSLGNYAQNVEADPSEMSADTLYSPSSYKKQKLKHPYSATPIVDNLGSKVQETADLSRKDIKIDQLLKHKQHEEVRSRGLQMVGEFQSLVVSLLNCIEKLEARIERKNKEIEELKYLMKEAATHAEDFVIKSRQQFQANSFATQQPQPQPQHSWIELPANEADMMAETIKSQQPCSQMCMDLLSSGNDEPLTSQNKNDHTEGAAAATLTDTNLGLCKPLNDQNEFPGNRHHQQQTIEPSSNGNISSSTMSPFVVLENFDTNDIAKLLSV